MLFLASFKSYSQDFELVNGVQVYFKVTPNMFPANFYEPQYKAHAVTAKHFDKQKLVSVIKKELSKYPVNVIATFLKRVYVIDSISFYGKKIDACYGSDAIYITANSRYFEISFNHELNSILYYHNKKSFPKEQWEKLNTVAYTGNEWTNKFDTDISNLYANTGFITEYSKTSFSNDMSCIAEYMMVPQPCLKQYLAKYPLVKAKFEMMKQFYLSIDSSFKFPALPSELIN